MYTMYLRITGQVGAGRFVRYLEVSLIGRLYHKVTRYLQMFKVENYDLSYTKLYVELNVELNVAMVFGNRLTTTN